MKNKSTVNVHRLADLSLWDDARKKSLNLVRYQLRAMVAAHNAGNEYEVNWNFVRGHAYSDIKSKATLYTPSTLQCRLTFDVRNLDIKPLPKAPKLRLVREFEPKAIDANFEAGVLSASGNSPKLDAYVIRHDSGLMLAQACGYGDQGLDTRGKWTVTHAKTGHSVGGGAMSFKRAVEFMNKVLPLANWTLDAAELVKDKALGPKMKELAAAA